jgi:hypothetical protein
MTEQMFIKEFSKMPESVKRELLTFFDLLINKHNLQIPVKNGKDATTPSQKSPKAGFLKGTFVMADDFDAPLDDFKEYIE